MSSTLTSYINTVTAFLPTWLCYFKGRRAWSKGPLVIVDNLWCQAARPRFSWASLCEEQEYRGSREMTKEGRRKDNSQSSKMGIRDQMRPHQAHLPNIWFDHDFQCLYIGCQIFDPPRQSGVFYMRYVTATWWNISQCRGIFNFGG